MSVNVDALIEHHHAFGTPQALCRVLDATPPFGAPGVSWRPDLEEFANVEDAFAAMGSTYVERDDDRGWASLGRRLTRLPEPEPGLKWYRFCEDTDGEYTRNAPLWHRLAAALGAKEILFLPDSGEEESKALDLVERDVGMERVLAYLAELGSEAVERTRVHTIRRPGGTSHGVVHRRGYLHERVSAPPPAAPPP